MLVGRRKALPPGDLIIEKKVWPRRINRSVRLRPRTRRKHFPLRQGIQEHHMKTIHLTLAAVSALAIATPLAAQTWQGGRAGGPSRSWNNDRPNLTDLRMQLDTGVARGTITRREASTLRIDLNALARLDRTYGRDGFSRSERSELIARGDSLQRMIRRAENNGNRGALRADWNERRDHAEAITIGVGPGHRGDRYSGDVRVGQHFSDRQVALPIQYRTRYQDNDKSYYRYDANRVYQIDRSSGLILAMFDVSN
jgi:hypothetical protein